MQPPRPHRNRIVVGLPLYAPVSPRWLMKWHEFEQELARYDRYAGIHETAMSYLELACNTIVKNALQAAGQLERPSEALGILGPEIESLRAYGDPKLDAIASSLTREMTVRVWDYLLMIESDNTMPPGLVEKVATLNPKVHKVVGFPYFGRTDEDLRPIPGMFKPDGSWERMTYDEIKPMFDAPGFHPVGSVGMGCTAIHRSVLEDWPAALKPRWFHCINEPAGFSGQDVVFCKEAVDFGLTEKIWLCTELEAGHLGEFLSTSRHFFATHEHMQSRESEAKSKREQAKREFLKPKQLTIATQHPIAADSIDHQHPFGAALDNSVSPEFNRRLFALRPEVRLLDLGCAGGGLVESILKDGGFAVGVEGSDVPRSRSLGAWPNDHLFTADIGQPFVVCRDSRPLHFNVVTAWGVLEHLPEERLDILVANVLRHLDEDGWFIASISTVESWHEGRQYHATVHPQEWWMDFLGSHGLRLREDLMPEFEGAWVRGPNTGLPHSFCVVMSR